MSQTLDPRNEEDEILKIMLAICFGWLLAKVISSLLGLAFVGN